MTTDTPHAMFMRQALRLAAKGRGFTSPNPMVGAIVVQQGEVVGQGFHQRVGGPHAEVNALRDAGDKARGATLYVTLEPCNHHGRTPPCTQSVLEAGVTQVVIGMPDPNPRVAGGGTQFLRSRGLDVFSGVLETECRGLNQAFIKHMTTGLPLVTIKAATTLDGRIATRTGDSRWISSLLSRRFVHRLRCDLDAILVGIGTALRDDPLLTARGVSKPLSSAGAGDPRQRSSLTAHQPTRHLRGTRPGVGGLPPTSVAAKAPGLDRCGRGGAGAAGR